MRLKAGVQKQRRVGISTKGMEDGWREGVCKGQVIAKKLTRRNPPEDVETS